LEKRTEELTELNDEYRELKKEITDTIYRLGLDDIEIPDGRLFLKNGRYYFEENRVATEISPAGYLEILSDYLEEIYEIGRDELFRLRENELLEKLTQISQKKGGMRNGKNRF